MIERIFIPTVHRVDNQITFNHLPVALRSKVSFVVQAWERPRYMYDCDYVILPDTPEYHFSDYYCLPRTRKFIYDLGQNMKYCVLDDDIFFSRRNVKYFGEASNMERSRQVLTDDETIDMFNIFDKWLDDVTVCGCAQIQNPPAGVKIRENGSLTSAYWINGTHFKDDLPKMDLTSVRVGEDVAFLLSLLTRGYKNRISEEYVLSNYSVMTKKMKSTVWDEQTYEDTQRDHKLLEKMFPGLFVIQYDQNGNREEGGYRNFGKSKINWNKAYKYRNNLSEFFIND